MGRRRKIYAGAAALSAGFAVATTVHAPKMIAAVPSETRLVNGKRSDFALHGPTPWPVPFASLADYVDDEPTWKAWRRPTPPPKRAKRTISPVYQTADDPILAAATPPTLPGPIVLAPSDYMMPIGPARLLPDPVTAPPFVPPRLEAPYNFGAPVLSDDLPSFVYGVDAADPLGVNPPVLEATALLVPTGGLVSVPEPSAVSAMLLAPLLLGRRRQA